CTRIVPCGQDEPQMVDQLFLVRAAEMEGRAAGKGEVLTRIAELHLPVALAAVARLDDLVVLRAVDARLERVHRDVAARAAAVAEDVRAEELPRAPDLSVDRVPRDTVQTLEVDELSRERKGVD